MTGEAMFCKYCGKLLNGDSLSCAKCREKYRYAKSFCLPNGTDKVILLLKNEPSGELKPSTMTENSAERAQKTLMKNLIRNFSGRGKE